MRCAHCEGDNPPSAKFCSHCGSGLSARCTACAIRTHQAPVSATNVAGYSMGDAPRAVAGSARRGPIPPNTSPRRSSPPRAPLEGERKQVTVLFCDIVESMVLAEQLGPEGRMKCWIEYCGYYGGDVHRLRGDSEPVPRDGLMALFGAPLALEDHAVRAIEAALSIQETINGYSEQLKRERGLDLKLRLGLNSGLVVVWQDWG